MEGFSPYLYIRAWLHFPRGARMGERSSRRGLSLAALAAVFMVAGVLHFAFPGQYERVMPPWLPHHRELVLLSGFFQLAGGLGVLFPRTRRAAGWGLILLLVTVWPANLQMLLDARASGASALAQALYLLRLPLQPVLMAWVWWASLRAA